MRVPISGELTDLTERVIGSAIAVHRELGPGFLESIYSRALRLELEACGIAFEFEKPVVVMYRGVAIPGQRVDFVVDGRLIVEVKAVAAIEPIHVAQVLSYLRRPTCGSGCCSTSASGCWRTGFAGWRSEVTGRP